MRLLAAIVALFLVSCASVQEEIGRRASFEMDCAEQDLYYAELSDNVWGVTGCGKRATYQRNCHVSGFIQSGSTPIAVRKCQWVKAN